jgi:lipopolysaccharide cholinephosphotransferase
LPQPYELVCAETDPTYPLPFGKVQDASTTLIERRHLRYLGGVYIDVFPLDGVPEGSLTRRLHFAAYEFYKRVLYLVHRDPYKHGHGPSSWIPLLCRKLFTVEGVLEYPFAQSTHICDYDDGLRGVMPKTELGSPTPVEFEGRMVWGVEARDTYLSRKYGDYMTIPKQGGQRQHNFHYMSLEEPYRDYKGE